MTLRDTHDGACRLGQTSCPTLGWEAGLAPPGQRNRDL
jgi:hypothetical protein